jgi:hypothetical protein
VRYLSDVGRPWAESRPDLQRRFVCDVFMSLEVEERELAAITPKAMYTPLFVVDRRVRFGSTVERLAQPCPLYNPLTLPYNICRKRYEHLLD